jgi:hypothetical protein
MQFYSYLIKGAISKKKKSYFALSGKVAPVSHQDSFPGTFPSSFTPS